MTTTNTLTFELVIFQLNDGVTKEEALKAAETVNEFVKEQEGFISRSLAISEEGVWMDFVKWENLTDAKAASEKAMTSPKCTDFFSMIDESTTKFMHLEPLLNI